MMLFVFPSYAGMGSELGTLLGIRMGQFCIDRFPNQEFHAIVQIGVVNEECVI